MCDYIHLSYRHYEIMLDSICSDAVLQRLSMPDYADVQCENMTFSFPAQQPLLS